MAVTVINGAPTGASFVSNGITFYQWNFTVNINGSIYIDTMWCDTNDPSMYPYLVPDIINGIENGTGFPPQGIAENDGNDDSSDDDDDSDGALASTGGDFGDSA
jgi:hypothetical protein